MTKLEELKAAYDAADDAYDAACEVGDDAWAARVAGAAAWDTEEAYAVAGAVYAETAAYVARAAAWDAYYDELKRTQEENSND
jgi:hypothetical protein